MNLLLIFPALGGFVSRSWPSTHNILKYPFLLILGIFMFISFAFWIIIRWVVRFLEVSLTSPRANKLKKLMLKAESIEEYESLASELDKVTHRNAWKQVTQSRLYNYQLMDVRLKQLSDARQRGDLSEILRLLNQTVHTNFAGIQNETLYSKSFTGTKHLIEDYIEEACESIRLLETSLTNPPSSDSNEIDCLASPEARQQLLKDTDSLLNRVAGMWGCSALCLSGGAMNGMHHFAVVKALFDEDLLPRVFCGASAGAVIAGYICTRTDDELRGCLTPENCTTVFRCFEPYSWIERMKNFIKKGHMFDADFWLEKLRLIYGDITFEEAFIKTGRVLNIAVSRRRGDMETPPMLINFLNAPHVLVISAIRASASFPFLIPAQQLLEKSPDGSIHPVGSPGDSNTKASSDQKRSDNDGEGATFSEFFQDGSIDADVPITQLTEQWGVHYTIVVQVNIHVYPWLQFRSKGAAGLPVAWRSGSGRWRGGFFLSALQTFLTEQMRALMRMMAVLDLLPRIMSVNWGKLILQDYQAGSLVMVPRRLFLWHFTKVLEDLSLDECKWFFHEGYMMIWPKMTPIRHRMKIEKRLEALRFAAAKLKSQYISSDEQQQHVNNNLQPRGMSPAVSPLPLHPSTYLSSFMARPPRTDPRLPLLSGAGVDSAVATSAMHEGPAVQREFNLLNENVETLMNMKSKREVKTGDFARKRIQSRSSQLWRRSGDRASIVASLKRSKTDGEDLDALIANDIDELEMQSLLSDAPWNNDVDNDDTDDNEETDFIRNNKRRYLEYNSSQYDNSEYDNDDLLMTDSDSQYSVSSATLAQDHKWHVFKSARDMLSSLFNPTSKSSKRDNSMGNSEFAGDDSDEQFSDYDHSSSDVNNAFAVKNNIEGSSTTNNNEADKANSISKDEQSLTAKLTSKLKRVMMSTDANDRLAKVSAARKYLRKLLSMAADDDSASVSASVAAAAALVAIKNSTKMTPGTSNRDNLADYIDDSKQRNNKVRLNPVSGLRNNYNSNSDLNQNTTDRGANSILAEHARRMDDSGNLTSATSSSSSSMQNRVTSVSNRRNSHCSPALQLDLRSANVRESFAEDELMPHHSPSSSKPSSSENYTNIPDSGQNKIPDNTIQGKVLLHKKRPKSIQSK